MDPFHAYANAIRDESLKAITVLNVFHVVKLGWQMVDEVRRRVQQVILGHRGRAGDPLYGVRRTLQTGAEHLTPRQVARRDASWRLGTRATRSLWPSATRSYAPSTTPTPRRAAGRSPR
ncbi:transposase [Kocuria rosea]|uniref:transposase n=1 Tax=Kocuria rosea TaxID=1275 RepID=UPI003018DF4A